MNYLPTARLASFSASRPRLVLIVTGCLLAIALGRLGSIQLKTSNLDLIDPKLPTVERFQKFTESFGTPNALVVVIEGDDGEVLRDAVDRLAPRLREREDIRAVIERLPYDREQLLENGLDPYLTNDVEDMFFIFVQPRDDRSQTSQLAPFVAGVEKVIQEAALDSSLKVGLTGIPKYALDDQNIIKGDITLLSFVALVFIALIFGLGFRALSGPLSATASVIVGVVLTLGVVSFYPGHLTVLSGMFASMIFGLGIDCGIHIVAHAEELAEDGQRTVQTLSRTFTDLQGPLNTAVFTTAGVFLMLLFSGFKGFAELGTIAAVGMLLCYLSMLTFLPALLVLLPKRVATRTKSSRLGQILRAVQSNWFPPLLLGATLLLPLVGMPLFDGNYLNLQPRDSQAVRLERRMIEHSDFSPHFAVFVCPDREASKQLADRLREEPTVASVRAISDLDELLDDAAPPPDLAHLFVDDKGHYAVYAYPAGNVWDEAENARFIEAMQSIDKEATGMPFLGDFMIKRVRDALRTTTILALLVLLVVTWLDFGQPKKILLAMLVPVLTMLWMGALMKLLGMAFNPLNVMAIPIVLGIAVDDAVHIIHRYQQEGIQATLAGAGRAVVLTSLTTLAAFGSVIFTSHRGLQGFSAALCLGVGLALLLSVTVLPYLLQKTTPGRPGRTA